MIFLASLLLGWGFSLTEPIAAMAGSLGEFSEVSRFSGRASRVGGDGAKASLKITADFAVPDSFPIDLSQGAEVFLEPLFEPESEGVEGAVGIIHSEEFLDFVDGIPLVVAGRAGVDRAKFNSSGRNPSMMVVSLIRRRGILRLTARLNRVQIAVPSACAAGSGSAPLAMRARVVWGGGSPGSLSLSTTQDWRCKERNNGAFDLRGEVRRGGGNHGNHGNHGNDHGGSELGNNERPIASIRLENLTRDRNALNWIRLDGRGSEDRDGRIVGHAYRVVTRPGGEVLEGPATTQSRIAHVALWPGEYEIQLMVRDDQGATATASRGLSISGDSARSSSYKTINWGLGESWRVGDPTVDLERDWGPFTLDVVVEAFDRPTPARLDRGTRDSGGPSTDSCGAVLNASGAAVGVLSFIPVAGPIFGMSAIGLNLAGAAKGNACVANTFDDLNAQLQIQEEQIQQIQSNLTLIDNAFYQVNYREQVFVSNALTQKYSDGLKLLGGISGLFGNFLTDINLAKPTKGPRCPWWSSKNPRETCTPQTSNDNVTVSECGTAACSSILEPELYPQDYSSIDAVQQAALFQINSNTQVDFHTYLNNVSGSQVISTRPQTWDTKWPSSVPKASPQTESSLAQLLESLAKTLAAQISAQKLGGPGFPVSNCAVENESCACTTTAYFGKRYLNSLGDDGDATGSGVTATFGQMITDPETLEMVLPTTGSSIECSYENFGGVPPQPEFNAQCFCQNSKNDPNLVSAYEGYNATLAAIYQQSLHAIQQAYFMEYVVNMLNYSYVTTADPDDPTSAPFSQCSEASQIKSWSGTQNFGTWYDCSNFALTTSAQRKGFNDAQFKLAAAYSQRVGFLYRLVLEFVFSDLPIAPQAYPTDGTHSGVGYEDYVGAVLLKNADLGLAATPIDQLESLSPGFNTSSPSGGSLWHANAALYQYGGLQDFGTCAKAVAAHTGTSLVEAFTAQTGACPSACTTCKSGMTQVAEGGTGLVGTTAETGGVCVNWCSESGLCGSESFSGGAGGTDCTVCVAQGENGCPAILHDASGGPLDGGYFDTLNLQPYSNIPAYGLHLSCSANCYADPSDPDCASCPEPTIALAGSVQSNIFPKLNEAIVVPEDAGAGAVTGITGTNSNFLALCEPGDQQMGWYQPSGGLVGNDAKLRGGLTYLMCGNGVSYDMTTNFKTFLQGNSNTADTNLKSLFIPGGNYESSYSYYTGAGCGHNHTDYLATVNMNTWACAIDAYHTSDVNAIVDTCTGPSGDATFQFGEITAGKANGIQTDQVFFNLAFPSVVGGESSYLFLAMFGQCTSYGCLNHESTTSASCVKISAYGNARTPCTPGNCSSSPITPQIPANGYTCPGGLQTNSGLTCTLADGRTYNSELAFSSEAVGTFITQQTNSGCEKACFACQSGGGAYAESVVSLPGDPSTTVCEDFCSGVGYCGEATLYSDNGSTNCQECEKVPAGDWLSSCTPIRWDSTSLCAQCTGSNRGEPQSSCKSCSGDYFVTDDGFLTCSPPLPGGDWTKTCNQDTSSWNQSATNVGTLCAYCNTNSLIGPPPPDSVQEEIPGVVYYTCAPCPTGAYVTEYSNIDGQLYCESN